MTHLPAAVQARFDSKWTQVGDCRLWTGAPDPDGYGRFHYLGLPQHAHRVAWFALHGPIPEGMFVNHTCRRRLCVNPQHLGLVTPHDNVHRDSVNRAYLNSQKTHCPRGHPYDRVWNSKRQGTTRGCSICEAAKRRRSRDKARRQGRVARI